MTNKINTALVYFTTLVLLSTLVITPVSISNSYWGMAYAEEQTIDPSLNSSSIIDQISSVGIQTPTTTEETTEETTTEETTTEETTTEEPTEQTTEESTEPVTEESTAEEPTEQTTEESTEPVTEESTAEEPTEQTTEESTEPVTEESTAEETSTETSTEPVTEETTTEETTTEQTTEEPTETTTEQTTEEPTETTTEETTTESTEPVTEESTAEQTTAEPTETTTEQTTTESTEPVIEETTTESTEPVIEETTAEQTTEEPTETTTEQTTTESTEPVIEETSTEPVTEETSTEPVTEETSTEPVTEETSTEPVTEETTEETSTEPVTEQVTEETTEPVTEPIIETNSTSTEPIIETNSTSTEPIIETNSTSTEPIIETNSTSTEPIIVPDATVSFQFDNLESVITNSTTAEPESVITNSTTAEPESTTLELSGQGDFLQIANVTTINDLNGLTVTAWVNPDYSSGSPEFTVVSKDKSFSLTISNNVSSENTAKFSVFDGIKWTAVESTSAITEDWSFLSSTFDGELIAIFVDGEREATQETIGVPTLTANGKLQTVSVENITSNEDIVIGASVTVKDEQPKSSNEFSGEIDDVSLYDYVLEDEQIFTMYEQTKDDYTATLPELTLEEIIAQMELELANSENSTSTEIILDTNSTSTEIILDTNSTSTEIILDTNSTSTEPIIPEITEIVSTEITLEHDEIEIGKTVTWTQTVTISDETDAVAIELPTNAEITKVITTDDKGVETILFEAEEISTSTGLVDDQDITQENIAELEIIEPTEIPVTTIITDDAESIITEDATYVDLEEVEITEPLIEEPLIEEPITEPLIEEPIVTDQPLAKASQRTAPLAAPSVSQPNNSKMIDLTQLDTSSSTIVDAGQSDVVMSEKMIPIASLEEEMPELL